MGRPVLVAMQQRAGRQKPNRNLAISVKHKRLRLAQTHPWLRHIQQPNPDEESQTIWPRALMHGRNRRLVHQSHIRARLSMAKAASQRNLSRTALVFWVSPTLINQARAGNDDLAFHLWPPQ